jgi:RNA polymerase-binding transcription factor DksA
LRRFGEPVGNKENAMSLTPEQSRTLKQRLEKRRAALVKELGEDAAHLREEPYSALAGEVRDSADESVADAIADTEQAELSRDLAELREVDAALARIVRKTYGTCAECGAEVPFKRLSATPWVARCAACQRTYEKTHAGGAGAKL